MINLEQFIAKQICGRYFREKSTNKILEIRGICQAQTDELKGFGIEAYDYLAHMTRHICLAQFADYELCTSAETRRFNKILEYHRESSRCSDSGYMGCDAGAIG